MILGILETAKREMQRLVCRRIYLLTMVVIPIAMSLFFLSLLNPGLPLKVPTAIIDFDNSTMSRKITRSLSAMETIEIVEQATSFNDAMDRVGRGDIFGFFLIPEDFEKEAISNRTPTISYYSNLTYFIPGTLAFKGFKTIAVSTSGNIVLSTLVAEGINPQQVKSLLQPVVVQDHPIHNPWTNYSIYLSNSFIPGVIALMILLVTSFSICSELKQGSSIKWIKTANGSILGALIGKLLPQTIIFSIIGIFCQSLLYGYNHFPLHCNPLVMIYAIILFVIATQAFAVFICSLIPNLRLAVSIVSLIGILSFSITGFSFPVESIYGAIGIFSYIIPLRYYFLIYVDQALNGLPLYYSRWYFIVLIAFPCVILPLLPRLKRALSHPVYIP